MRTARNTTRRAANNRKEPGTHAGYAPHQAAMQKRDAGRESLWSLFRVVFGLSALSWGGLALMAQLEHHYVERERRLSRLAFADLMALAWMVPGPVGCNVAVQLGHTLRGRAGAWVAGVLPFFMLMTLLAIFYHTPLVHAAASQTLLNHFSVVLATLIAVTWYKQTRALVRGRLEWSAAVLGGGCWLMRKVRQPTCSCWVALSPRAGWRGP